MSVELQLKATVLSDMILRGIQARLGTSCFPSFPFNSAGVREIVYIDHLDVAAVSVDVVVTGNAALLEVPVDVFIVTQSALLAAPNSTPAGATVPAGQAVLKIKLNTAVRTVTNTQGQPEVHQYLDLTCTEIIPQGPLNSVPVDWNAFRSQLDSLASLDLNPMLAAFGNQALIPVRGINRVRRGGGRGSLQRARRPGQPSVPRTGLGIFLGREGSRAIDLCEDHVSATSAVATHGALGSGRHRSSRRH